MGLRTLYTIKQKEGITLNGFWLRALESPNLVFISDTEPAKMGSAPDRAFLQVRGAA